LAQVRKKTNRCRVPKTLIHNLFQMARFAARASAVIMAILSPSSADFLAARAPVSKHEVEQALFMDMTNSDKVAKFQEELWPMYKTLPKNERGHLETPTVRYALHRFFSHKHGWYVKGLDPQGAGLGNSTSAQVMSEVVPMYILELFEQRSHGKGVELHELAVFAATMSDLIFQEGLGSLWEAYRKLELPEGGEVSESEFDVAVRVYFSELICAEFFDFQHRSKFGALEAKARDFYPEYDDIIMWARDLRKAKDFNERANRNPFKSESVVTWDQAAEHLRELMHNFGILTKDECRGVKEQLMDMEVPGTGRVMLSDFYANTGLQMHESVDYLRNLGTLEEESSHPRIIVSNYIASISRCTPFSSYFSICCRDECEGIMSSLESALGSPQASPARIAETVSMISSDTKIAPWNISSHLKERLQDIATRHQGQVPVHGRLFTQWMHHAFPAECQFPHVSGTTNPVSQDEWLARHEHLDNVFALPDERDRILQKRVDVDASAVDLPWTNIEELVAMDKTSRKPRFAQTWMRTCMGIIALVSFALPLTRAANAMLSIDADKAKTEHLV